MGYGPVKEDDAERRILTGTRGVSSVTGLNGMPHATPSTTRPDMPATSPRGRPSAATMEAMARSPPAATGRSVTVR